MCTLQQLLFFLLVVHTTSTMRHNIHTFDFSKQAQIYSTVTIHIDLPRLLGTTEMGLSQ